MKKSYFCFLLGLTIFASLVAGCVDGTQEKPDGVASVENIAKDCHSSQCELAVGYFQCSMGQFLSSHSKDGIQEQDRQAAIRVASQSALQNCLEFANCGSDRSDDGKCRTQESLCSQGVKISAYSYQSLPLEQFTPERISDLQKCL